ncbi:MAG: CHAT domain-containing protein, partial [Leptolyngbyaceae cyanobacterium]
CRTGLGASVGVDPKQEIKGEGLVGLTGSFMYAGAERVIASLWSVDDAATTELMQLFYRNVFEKKMPYAAALRQAQRQMQANPRWREPYYWAGFIIQGEWR